MTYDIYRSRPIGHPPGKIGQEHRSIGSFLSRLLFGTRACSTSEEVNTAGTFPQFLIYALACVSLGTNGKQEKSKRLAQKHRNCSHYNIVRFTKCIDGFHANVMPAFSNVVGLKFTTGAGELRQK